MNDLPFSTKERQALSVQQAVEDYIDSGGYAERLAKMIEEYNGGVIGVTGLRGAGKSALIARVLSNLQPIYFTLALTAPVRHEGKMDFFLTVSRSVCRQAMDNAHPVLFGGTTRQKQAVEEIIATLRNVLLVGTLLAAGWIILGHSGWMVWTSSNDATSRDPRMALMAHWGYPAREEAPQIERLLVVNLLGQVQQVQDVLLRLSDADAKKSSDGQRYLFVPPKGEKDFKLVPMQESIPIDEQLKKLGPDKDWLEEGIGEFPLETTREQWGIARIIARYVNGFRPINSSMTGVIVKAWVIDLPNKAKRSHEVLLRQQANLFGELVGLQNPESVFAGGVLAEAYVRGNKELAFNKDKLKRLAFVLEGYRDILSEARTNETPVSVGIADVSRSIIQDQRILGLLAVALMLALAGKLWQLMNYVCRGIMNSNILALYRESEEFMGFLSYTENLESTTGLSWQGINLGRKRMQVARDLTLPSLTNRYVAYVRELAKHCNGKLIITIDELDKIHDVDMVKALLAEIKGALFVKGCYYIISISEDATRSFRSRLAAGRDIFESTFDDIIHVSQMDSAAAIQMIRARLRSGQASLLADDECIRVMVMFGGGIPREILRNFRALVMEGNKTTLMSPGEAARAFFVREVREWNSHLAEAALSGSDVVRLRSLGQIVQDLIANRDHPTPAEHAQIWFSLRDAVAIIDPDGLAQIVVYVDNPDDKAAVAQYAKYKRVLPDLQNCIRLMIMATIYNWITQGGDAWKAQEDGVLACFRSLSDKPALATTLLQEMRLQTSLSK